MNDVLDSPARWRDTAIAALGPLCTIGAAYAYTYTGAITLGHLTTTALSYFLLFAMQSVFMVGLVWLATSSPRLPIAKLLRLHLVTCVPLELAFFFLLFLFAFASSPYRSLFTMLRSYIPLGIAAAAFVWSVVLTVIAFRQAVRGSPWIVTALSLAYYAIEVGVVMAYIYGMGLLPLPSGQL
jgi:predicted neutral ceramidase superfamily lipid hydrolase